MGANKLGKKPSVLVKVAPDLSEPEVESIANSAKSLKLMDHYLKHHDPDKWQIEKVGTKQKHPNLRLTGQFISRLLHFRA
ncbi:putative dihydroorotate dehydrogenase (quinone) [Clavispora lusitaniae]|uniref:Dihydroorotate dehydrogenase (Quinone) n=1 Tax=Clavispora lusitaniae TaxID=36911 RepID=A0AA91T4K4_CLALS|nr:putative dihydroorotate dehydrogenase (quinone) [Clavispora lusitaniae]